MNRRNFFQSTAGGAAAAALAGSFAGSSRAFAATTQAAKGRPAEEIATDEDFWAAVRDEFTTDRTVINLNNGHVYLRRHLDFFPADAIGAANARDGQGVPLTVHFAGLPAAAQTDIAGDKGIFRSRGPWRQFLAHHSLRPGDTVIIERLTAYEYRVVPGR